MKHSSSLTSEPPKPKKKDEAAVASSRLGGRKGGNARAKTLTPEERHDIAQRAAKQRWARNKENS